MMVKTGSRSSDTRTIRAALCWGANALATRNAIHARKNVARATPVTVMVAAGAITVPTASAASMRNGTISEPGGAAAE